MFRTFAKLSVGGLLVLVPAIARADALTNVVAEDVRGLMPLYRELHANPELSMKVT